MQKAIRLRLVGSLSVTALVPAANILDRNARPAPDPSIIIGEGQAVDEERIARNVQRIFMDLHVWKKEPSTAGVKAIAGAIRGVLQFERLSLEAPYSAGDCAVTGMRYLRDPDGETSHGVVTLEVLVSEAV
jgi:hypothetical protein